MMDQTETSISTTIITGAMKAACSTIINWETWVPHCSQDFVITPDIPTGNRDMEIIVPPERRGIFNLIQKVLPIHSGIQIIFFLKIMKLFLQKIFSGSHRN